MSTETPSLATTAAIAEARRHRAWRERCGEPCRDRFPVRCRRDLEHPSPHVGIVGEDLVSWRGTGNADPVQVTGQNCWCSEEVPGV